MGTSYTATFGLDVPIFLENGRRLIEQALLWIVQDGSRTRSREGEWQIQAECSIAGVLSSYLINLQSDVETPPTVGDSKATTQYSCNRYLCGYGLFVFVMSVCIISIAVAGTVDKDSKRTPVVSNRGFSGKYNQL
eukprot:scaffold948_cov106-Cylindrotheca_fusiformis.AAC.6